MTKYEIVINDLLQDELKQPHTEFSRGRYDGLLAAKRAVQDAEADLQQRIWNAWEELGVEPR